MYKKFALTVTICIVLMLSIFAGSIIIIDPMFHYHAPILNMKPYLQSELQQNHGVVKNLEYDSILLGSSMAENFDMTWFNEKFDCQTVKLTYQAAKIKNYRIMLEESFGSRDLKNVFISLDPDTLTDDGETTFFPLPEYLYDDKVFNDVNYVLNKDVFFEYLIPYVMLNIKGEVKDISKAYEWCDDPNIEYSKDAVIRSLTWDLQNISEYQMAEVGPYTKNSVNNIKNVILPHVIDNPDTQFYVFYPPYNIAWWGGALARSKSKAYFSIIESSMELLLPYDNVHIYYFQDEEDIIYNFNEYKDYGHYSPAINKFIVDNLSGDKYLLTEENYLEKLKNIKEIVAKYDYSQLS